MKYIILDISDLNDINWVELSNCNENTVRRSKNGSKFVIKYNTKPSFIDEAIEYSHDEIRLILSTPEWTDEIGI
ncbi:MAG: hypothetical protein Unbinned221contig1000_40 [Prokaryotic dsDNA virus sp.]|nr:MAG: hypothetical protein Unbinned221contig1000_40 [Prokaryotic dsDNA virus sp.]|tara:strand:- start:1366 stop:1587 length:222 start_codon:yes stop_codon:yes gene_type:complete